MTPDRAARILGLDGPWTYVSIKKAYRSRSRETHPDRGGDEEQFKRVNEAMRVLEAHVSRGRDFSGDDLESDSEPDQEDISIGAWFDVLCVRCSGEPVEGRFRAQLVKIGQQRLHRDGQSIDKRWMIAVYAVEPVELTSDLVEVVIVEPGETEPSVFVREVCQRSYAADGKVSAFWFDPLSEPVIEEEVVYRHAGWERPTVDPLW